MKILLSLATLFCSFFLHAQYYYNDIIVTQDLNRQMQTYVANKVKMVTATGYTPQGTKATDFAEVQAIIENGKTLKISRNSELTYSSFYQRYDEQNRLISIIDTTQGVRSNTTYEYNVGGRITVIQNTVKDTASDIDMVELHKWIYNKDGKVEKMWRTINGADSLEIRFFPDEKGNPGEERTFRNGYETDMLYYYFDERNRLTDIVRYDKKVKKLVPDFIFTYDESDRIIQKITSAPSENFGVGGYGKVVWVKYMIWRFIYNAQGLKTKEALFDKDQQLTGKIEYSYTFGQ
jgi:hypothetical protein